MAGRRGTAQRNSGTRKPQKLSASRRLALCTRCPYLTRDKRCTLCGCFVKAKTKVPTEKCPNGYWA